MAWRWGSSADVLRSEKFAVDKRASAKTLCLAECKDILEFSDEFASGCVRLREISVFGRLDVRRFFEVVYDTSFR